MCTMIVEKVAVSGSGKGRQGWFPLKEASVAYDHPYHLPMEHSLNISFLNEDRGMSARVAVELTPESARALVGAIEAALARRPEGT